MGFVLPLLWAIVGPELPDPPALPAPDAVAHLEADPWQGWRTVTGGATGLAVGAGVPLAVVGGGSAWLAYLIPLGLNSTVTGLTPALCSLATGFCGIYPALMCFPMGGALLATAGVTWGAQADGKSPWPAFVGATPGLALALTATVLGGVATGMSMFGGAPLIAPILLVVLAAVLTGLPAPFVAYIGAVTADGLWPGIQDSAERRRREWFGDEPAGAMAY